MAFKISMPKLNLGNLGVLTLFVIFAFILSACETTQTPRPGNTSNAVKTKVVAKPILEQVLLVAWKDGLTAQQKLTCEQKAYSAFQDATLQESAQAAENVFKRQGKEKTLSISLAVTKSLTHRRARNACVLDRTSTSEDSLSLQHTGAEVADNISVLTLAQARLSEMQVLRLKVGAGQNMSYEEAVKALPRRDPLFLARTQSELRSEFAAVLK